LSEENGYNKHVSTLGAFVTRDRAVVCCRYSNRRCRRCRFRYISWRWSAFHRVAAD